METKYSEQNKELQEYSRNLPSTNPSIAHHPSVRTIPPNNIADKFVSRSNKSLGRRNLREVIESLEHPHLSLQEAKASYKDLQHLLGNLYTSVETSTEDAILSTNEPSKMEPSNKQPHRSYSKIEEEINDIRKILKSVTELTNKTGKKDETHIRKDKLFNNENDYKETSDLRRQAFNRPVNDDDFVCQTVIIQTVREFPPSSKDFCSRKPELLNILNPDNIGRSYLSKEQLETREPRISHPKTVGRKSRSSYQSEVQGRPTDMITPLVEDDPNFLQKRERFVKPDVQEEDKRDETPIPPEVKDHMNREVFEAGLTKEAPQEFGKKISAKDIKLHPVDVKKKIVDAPPKAFRNGATEMLSEDEIKKRLYHNQPVHVRNDIFNGNSNLLHNVDHRKTDDSPVDKKKKALDVPLEVYRNLYNEKDGISESDDYLTEQSLRSASQFHTGMFSRPSQTDIKDFEAVAKQTTNAKPEHWKGYLVPKDETPLKSDAAKVNIEKGVVLDKKP